jgi:glycosyltransferase involved in cell wall biosynthesis
MGTPILYIVVPCYNEEEVLRETNSRLTALLRRLVDEGKVSADSRVMYVNDGSRDRTWELIRQFHDEGPVRGVNLAGNVGHQHALLAGMTVAKDLCDVLVSIDADLQDDIEAIPAMLARFADGCDIVYGVRKERKTDTFFKRNTALAFYKLMRALGVKSVYNHADYRLMSKRAVEQLCRYKERNLFLRGIVPLVGYRTDTVYYDRSARLAGESKYPFSKMLNFAIDGITSFSVKPLRLIVALGIAMVIMSLAIFVYVLTAYAQDNVVPGWSSLMISIWFVGGCTLISLGVVGEYIGKIYIEVKERPQYNIEELL